MRPPLSLAIPALLSLPALAATTEFAPFDDEDFGGWTATGNAFGDGPSPGGVGRIAGEVAGYSGTRLVTSFARDDQGTGTLTSPEFTVEAPLIRFLAGGGPLSENLAVQLLVDGQVVRAAAGQRSNDLQPVTWDVRDLAGRQARLRIVDQVSQPDQWGVIYADHFVFTDDPASPFPPTLMADGSAPPTPLAAAAGYPTVQIVPQGVIAPFASTQNQGVHDLTAVSVDDQGVVYVTESGRFIDKGIDDNRHRRYWILDDIASQTLDDRLAMYAKHQDRVPLSYYTEHEETIRRLVDGDGDRVADSHTLFADGFNDALDGTAAGILAFEKAIYLACIPSVWKLDDSDGDGVADSREALHTGWGIRVSYSGHDLNGFTFGPDGRLWFTVGDRGYNLKDGQDRPLVGPNRGACFRMDLDGSNLELVHDGLRNPKEIAFDDYGNLVTVDNNSDQGDKARVVVIAEGADSGWRMGHQVLHSFHSEAGLAQPPPKPWMAQEMWAPADEVSAPLTEQGLPLQPAHFLPPLANLTSGPSGMVWLGQGSRFPEDERGAFLVCDYRGAPSASGVQSFRIAADGASWSLVRPHWLLRGVAASDLDLAPDGGLYVTDYMGQWSQHGSGIVWRYTGAEGTNAELADATEALFRTGFDLPADRLAPLLVHPDQRVRLRATWKLATTAEPAVAGAIFTRLLAGEAELPAGLDPVVARLHGVWGLGQLLRLREDADAAAPLLAATADADWQVAREAVRALGQAPAQVPQLADALRDRLADPTEAQVTAEAARQLAKVGNAGDLELLLPLLAENDNHDKYLREALVFALTRLASADDLAALTGNGSPAVRLAAVVALRRQASERVADFLADEDPAVAREALITINEVPLPLAYAAAAALIEPYLAPAPATAAPTEDAAAALPPAADPARLPLADPLDQWRLINVNFRLGTPAAAANLLRYAANPALAMDWRVEAMRRLEQWHQPFPVDQSTGLFDPLPARDPAAFREVFGQFLPTLLESDDGPIRAAALRIAPRYGVPVPAAQLLELLADAKLDSGLRREALRSLVEQQPADLAAHIAPLLTDADPALQGDALAALAGLDAPATLARIQAIHADAQLPAELRQRAWTVLSDLADPAARAQLADAVTRLEGGELPGDEMLEVLDAVTAGGDAALIARADAWKQAREAEAVSKPWLVEGGSVAEGRQIFESHGSAQCVKCHSLGGNGGNAAPPLDGIALRYDHAHMLQNLLTPSANIAPGFASQKLRFTDEREVTGLYWGEDEQSVAIQLPDSSIVRVAKADIRSRSPMASSMYPMGDILNEHELRSVLAFLNTQKEAAPGGGGHGATESAAAPVFAELPLVALADLNLPAPDPNAVVDGAAVFAMHCQTCHQADGQGLANLYPPLAGSEWLQRSPQILGRIVLHGLHQPITVKGIRFANPASRMEPLGETLNDAEIAAALTYARNSWGNQGEPITAEQIAAVRAATQDQSGYFTADLLAAIEAPPASVAVIRQPVLGADGLSQRHPQRAGLMHASLIIVVLAILGGGWLFARMLKRL